LQNDIVKMSDGNDFSAQPSDAFPENLVQFTSIHLKSHPWTSPILAIAMEISGSQLRLLAKCRDACGTEVSNSCQYTQLLKNRLDRRMKRFSRKRFWR